MYLSPIGILCMNCRMGNLVPTSMWKYLPMSIKNGLGPPRLSTWGTLCSWRWGSRCIWRGCPIWGCCQRRAAKHRETLSLWGIDLIIWVSTPSCTSWRWGSPTFKQPSPLGSTTSCTTLALRPCNPLEYELYDGLDVLQFHGTLDNHHHWNWAVWRKRQSLGFR